MTVAKAAAAAKPKGLLAKLVEVAQAIDHVEKGGYNEAQRYNYVKAVDVARVVRNELAARGVVPVTSMRLVSIEPAGNTRSGAAQYLTTVAGTVTFHDSESPDFISFDTVGQGIDTGDKGIYKAITGALKYALTTAFLIPNESDDPEVTRKDELEAASPQVKTVSNAQYTGKRPAPNLATDEDKVAFLKLAQAHGLEGKKVSAFVGIVTGGKARSSLTRSDIDLLTKKLDDTELVEQILEATVEE